jgi:hypothetical protein
MREGQCHTADGGQDFILPVLDELACDYWTVWLRVDAAFPEPVLLSALET